MSKSYLYNPTDWLDQIIMLDEYGRVVYETDDAGNIVYWEDPHGNLVLDPITREPVPKPRLLQEGTRHSAARENNQEEGILKSHERLDAHDKDLLYLRVQMELDGRAPGNSGVFSDTLDDSVPNKMTRLTAMADIISAVEAGATVLPVDNTTGFFAFTEVTVYDGTNTEDVLITAIGDGTITVQALANSYVKGAGVARSTARIADGQMGNGSWGTYTVSVLEVV